MKKRGLLHRLRNRGLIKASERGELANVKTFVTRGANLNTEKNDGTPLSHAIESGHLTVVDYLVSCGATMSIRDVKRHETPLHRSTTHGHYEIVKFLVAHGADINARIEDGYDEFNHGATPLHMAVMARHHIVSEAIPSDLWNTTRHAEFARLATPQHISREANILEVVESLVRQGADINASWGYSSSTTTPLMYAIKDRDLSFVQYLVNLGANVNARVNADGETPLIRAVWEGSLPIVEFLVEHGADVNARNLRYCEQCCALEVAAGLELMPIVMFLVKHGATDVDLALAGAVRSKKIEACRVLVEYGKDAKRILRGLENAPMHRAVKTHGNVLSPESILQELCKTSIEQFPDSALWEVAEIQDVVIRLEIGSQYEGGTYWSPGVPGMGGHVTGQTYVRGRDVVISLDRAVMRGLAREELLRRFGSEKVEKMTATRAGN